ncbi:uncharacterized protein LOC134527954 [Bacillus rossius redtenbacheri]|uniref:uncharacterized protein LOC134527954 n=1 Tax=Bacillus rossius redtenbacheri TaxID=93214 RepID=UPI002FDE96D7
MEVAIRKPKKEFFKYSEENLKAAIDAVQSGNSSIRKAAKDYGVPFSTLNNKVKGKVPLQRKMGPSSILSEAEENLLVCWIHAYAKKGFPIKRITLFETVRDIVLSDQRPTPFKDGQPGIKWFKSFLKRHPTLSERYAESINTARATVTEESLRQWFHELKGFLEQENHLDILNDPSRIYNADESGFETCPKTGKVLGPVSFDNLYEVKSGNEKEAITVMANFNAAGNTVSPMIVFPLQKISREIAQNLNSEWGVGRSKKGWMTGALYYEYIANIFLPWLKKRNVQFPVLLLVDGHKSHTTYKVAQFCADNGIIQFALYPNATHVLQPADVAIFRPLKAGWRNVVYSWKHKTGNKVVTKVVFGPLLEAVFTERATVDTVKSGFRKCGIFPFDPDAVDYSKCMSSKSRNCPPVTTRSSNDTIQPASFGVEHLLYLETLMKKGRAEEFRAAEKSGWGGEPQALELYEVWCKIRSKCVSVPSAKTPKEDNLASSDEDSPSEITVQLPETSVSVTTNVEEDNLDTSKLLDEGPVGDILQPAIDEIFSPQTCNNVVGEMSGITEENPLNACCTSASSINTEGTHSSVTPKINRPSMIRNVKQQISSSFADHILWPSESPVKVGRKREHLPYATTSKEWLQWNESKERIKQEKEAAKRMRLEKRINKDTSKSVAKLTKRLIFSTKPQTDKTDKCKKLVRKKKQTHTSSESDTEEWHSSGDNMDDVSLGTTSESDENKNDQISTSVDRLKNLKEGDFVLVSFPGLKNLKYRFVCTIQKITDGEYIEVMGLKSSDKNNTVFRIDEDDVSFVKHYQILKKLPTPRIVPIGDRIRYKFDNPVEVSTINP